MVMDEMVKTIMLNFALGFFFGIIPSFLLLKGFISAYLNVRFSSGKYLLCIHMPDNISLRWRAGSSFETGVKYSLDKKEHLITIDEGVVKRTLGVNLINVSLGDTAPYSFTKVQWFDKATGELDENKKPVYERVLGKFQQWSDSHAVMILIRTALLQPKSALSLGKLDFKKVLIILGIGVLVYFVVQEMKGTGGNVI